MLLTDLIVLLAKELKKFIQSEYFIWVTIALIVSFRFLLRAFFEPQYLLETTFEYYFDVLSGLLILLFPVVFYQIFGTLPLQSIKNKKQNSTLATTIVNGNVVYQNSTYDAVNNPSVEKVNNTEQNFTNTIELLNKIRKDSLDLSNAIYRRSGVYLLFGVLIAISGVIYFSLEQISIPKDTLGVANTLILLAPKFGVLFFIEFIAFFFLKQYRVAMDEFRHYEAIKRNRESQLAIFLMATTDFKETNFTAIIEKINFFQNVGVLSQGETTELLELNKLNKDELEILKNFLTEIGKIKKTDK